MTDSSRTSGLIRMLLMGTAFIGLTIVLIVFQPGSPRNAQLSLEPETEASVTRGAEPLAVSAPAPVTPLLPETAVVVVPVPQPASLIDQPTNMRDMTFSAISNLKSVTTGEAPAPGQPGSLLHSVVKRSIAGTASGQDTAASPTPINAIEPVRTQQPDPATTGAYFVRQGDTLISIAKDVYGDSSLASEIFANNTDILARPDGLRAGMVLKLPVP